MRIPTLADQALGSIADTPLLAHARALGRLGRSLIHRFLALLPELERRRLHHRAGCASVAEFAARTAGVGAEQVKQARWLHERVGKYPEIWEPLVRGRLSWTKVRVVATRVTAGNVGAWVERVRTQTRAVLERLVREDAGRVAGDRVAARVAAVPSEGAGDPAGSGLWGRADPVPHAEARTPCSGGGAGSAMARQPGVRGEGPSPHREETPVRSGSGAGGAATGEGLPGSSGHDPAGEGFASGIEGGRLGFARVRRSFDLDARTEHDLEAAKARLERDAGRPMAWGEVLGRLARGYLEGPGAAPAPAAERHPEPVPEVEAVPRGTGPGVLAAPDRGEAAGQGSRGQPSGGQASGGRGSGAARVIEVVFTSAESGASWMRTLRGLVPVPRPPRPGGAEPPPLRELHARAVERVVEGAGSAGLPAAVRRFVTVRAGGRCEVPGCHGPLAELHHRRARALGGSHHPDNVVGLCAVHHAAAHSGALVLDGDPETWRLRGVDEALERTWIDVEHGRRSGVRGA